MKDIDNVTRPDSNVGGGAQKVNEEANEEDKMVDEDVGAAGKL